MKYIDLHCHLDGSLPLKTIRRLAKRSGIALPDSENELKTFISAPLDCQDLKQYLECFNLPVACLQTRENLYEAARDVVIAAADDNTVYIELRFAPLLHTAKNLKPADIMESVIYGMNAGVKQVRTAGKYMASGVIACGMRHMSVEDNVQMLKAIADFKGHGLCGVDIAGNEADFPPYGQKDFFGLAGELKLPVTIHAGECGSVQNVLDAAELGAVRIGHGIALYKDADARRICRERGLSLELCPTSNLQTKAVSSRAEYPLRLFMREGLKVTINTDNRTVSQTTMTQEMELLRRAFGLGEDCFRKIYVNSVEAAFASDSVKNDLLQMVV